MIYESDHLFCDITGKYRFEMQIYKEAKDFIFKLVDHALSRGENVALSGVFPVCESIYEYKDLAKAHKAGFEVITCVGNYGSVHNVPVTILDKMKSVFEDYYE